MSYFDQFYRRDLCVEKLPDGDWCLPVTDPEPRTIAHWIWRVVDPLGRTAVSGYVHSEEEGLREIARYHESVARFWQEKIDWRDHAPNAAPGRNVLRVDNTLYVVQWFGLKPATRSSARDRRGFGGQALRWHWLWIDGQPNAEIIESDNVWWVGHIPEQFREALPDNAVWEKK